MIFVLDNYDSFTFNLVHLLRQTGEEVVVRRSDALTPRDVLALAPRRIVISPGPGHPAERGISVELVRSAAGLIPVLGVCLGHQAIALAFGGRVRRARVPVHGKTSRVRHDGRTLFEGLPDPIEAMRYHSLVVDEAALPCELEVSARVDDEGGTIMALRHRQCAVEGIQFHPESFLTPDGAAMIGGFLEDHVMMKA
jgi:anthranilate synthase/aminodeoxychorismate synthase-like glutamine amidotransferase